MDNIHNLIVFKKNLKNKIFKDLKSSLNQLDLDSVIFFISFIENSNFNLLKSKDYNILYYTNGSINLNKDSTISRNKIENLISLIIHKDNSKNKTKISKDIKNCS